MDELGRPAVGKKLSKTTSVYDVAGQLANCAKSKGMTNLRFLTDEERQTIQAAIKPMNCFSAIYEKETDVSAIDREAS